jgi:hypothetical protein
MTEPIGPEYGLEPRIDHTLVSPPVTSRDILTNLNDYRNGTEYGGVAGLVQPAPHVPTASERLSAIYAIDPTDSGTEVGSVVPPELDGLFHSEY